VRRIDEPFLLVPFLSPQTTRSGGHIVPPPPPFRRITLFEHGLTCMTLAPPNRLCPLLNGTIKQEDGYNNAAFMGAPPTMS